MREFIYYSKNAVTAGNFIKDDLMKAGRLDIACNVIIQTLFISGEMRGDVKIHLIFDGPPNPPIHIEIFPQSREINISKKDVAGLIKKMLYKVPRKKGEKVEVAKGYNIEKKSLIDFIKELKNEGKGVYLLDKKGEDIREIKLAGNEVFVFGDQEGIPKKEIRSLKNLGVKKVSVGPKNLFASQVAVIVNNEVDRQETKGNL
ncbi:MAG: tRNA (pseudouridine(54)-N(1))-methyltransferase TrmY [Candidatus Pacearchaeota archaeon]